MGPRNAMRIWRRLAQIGCLTLGIGEHRVFFQQRGRPLRHVREFAVSGFEVEFHTAKCILQFARSPFGLYLHVAALGHGATRFLFLADGTLQPLAGISQRRFKRLRFGLGRRVLGDDAFALGDTLALFHLGAFEAL